MKNKSLIACMIFVSLAAAGISSNAKGNDPKTARVEKVSNYEAVIGDYIDGFMNSNYKKLDNALSDNATVRIPRQGSVVVQNKLGLVEKMREDNGVKQNCTSSYEVIAKSDAIVIARVDFQYAMFKQQNYITMERNEGQEWKITQICRISQNNDKPVAAPSVVAAY